MPTSSQPPAGAAGEDAPTGSGPAESFDALPIHVVDLGKAKPKAIKALKRGDGKLHQAVVEALGDIEFNLGDEAAGKTVLPVVVLVEKKRKRRNPLSFL
jgi:hypothetical protein